MRNALIASLFGAALAAAPAHATVFKASFENLNGSQTIGAPVNAGDLIAFSGLIENQSGALTNSVTFNAEFQKLDLSAAWFVKTNSRLVGVNIDLLDSTNTVVASDTFQGFLAGVAVSSLTFAGLHTGSDYTLKVTGNSIVNGNYDIKVDALVPIPAAALMLATALGGLGVIGYRRSA